MTHPPCRLLPAGEFVDELVMVRADPLRQEHVQRLPECLGRRPAEDLLGAPVEMDDSIVLIHGHHGVRGNGEDPGEHRVRSVPFFLETLTLRERRPHCPLAAERKAHPSDRAEQRAKSPPRCDVSRAEQVARSESERDEKDSDREGERDRNRANLYEWHSRRHARAARRGVTFSRAGPTSTQTARSQRGGQSRASPGCAACTCPPSSG